MGMSTRVIGFIPPDNEWKKMKEVWDACKKARVAVPNEVERFFDHAPPDESGVQIEIQATKWSSDSAEGYEVELSKLPEHVKVIRFYNSW